jgi:hypothetical protein
MDFTDFPRSAAVCIDAKSLSFLIHMSGIDGVEIMGLVASRIK